MAWQSGPNANGGNAVPGPESTGVQAYTLQGRFNSWLVQQSLTPRTGVMRFLQTEWHRHERDRNAWEIEREEMKKRIGHLEGESRTSRGVRVSLEKHVKILEMALKKEREKIKALNKGESVDTQRDPRDVARDELKAAGTGKRFL
jgi:striatin 1/3/4